MKVLLINDNYSYVGGAETYFFNLYKLFKENKNDTYLFSMGKEGIRSNGVLVAQETTPRKKLIESKNFKDISIWVLRKSITNFDYLEWIKKNIAPSWFQEFTKYQYIQLFGNYFIDKSIEENLRNWMREINPYIVHIQNNYKYPISVYSSLKNMDVPVVKTVHDFGIICPTSWCIKPDGEICEGGIGEKCVKAGCITDRYYKFMRPVSKIVTDLEKNFVRFFITPSELLMKQMEEHEFDSVVHIPNFIDINRYEYDNSKIREGNILFVGNLTKHKGAHYLIEAFPRILREFPDSRLNIVGSGPFKSYLENKAGRLGIRDHVVFYGYASDDNVKELYQKANVVVVPSIWMENSPLVIYEAMASGRSVVGSKIGGIPELVRDGKTGFLVEPGNPEDIAEKVIKIISEHLAEKFGDTARKTVIREYSAEKHYENLMKLYRRLV